MSAETKARLALPEAEALVHALAGAVRNRGASGRGASRAESTFEVFLEALRASHGTHPLFALDARNGMLLYEGAPLKGAVGVMVHVAKLLEARHCTRIAFRQGFAEEALREVVRWLSERRPEPAPRGLVGIDVTAPEIGAATDGEALSPEIVRAVPAFRLAYRLHRAASKVLSSFMAAVVSNKTLDYGEVEELSLWVAESVQRHGARIAAPAQVRTEDPYGSVHAVNVFLLATVLLRPLATDRRDLARLARAALLHDVGKARVSPAILGEPGELAPHEQEALDLHTIHGVEILQGCLQADPLDVEVAYCHHMRDHGLGYPRPVLPISPGPVSHVVQVSDQCETIAANLPLGEPLSLAAIAETIQATPGMKTRRTAAAHLLDELTPSPPGSEIRLESGVRALVVDVRPDAPDHPRVFVFSDDQGRPLPEGYDLDLADTPDQTIAEIRLKPAVLPRAE